MATVYDFLNADSSEVEEQRVIRVAGTTGDVLTLQANGTVSPAPGGGSQPDGILTSADFTFTERATAGVYTATLAMPAGSQIVNMASLAVVGPWVCDNAELLISDSETTFVDTVDAGQPVFVAGTFFLDTTYDPSAPIEPDMNASLAQLPGANASAPVLDWVNGNGPKGAGRYYEADDTLTIQVTTTIAVPPVVPAGIMRIKVIYFTPISAVAASFA